MRKLINVSIISFLMSLSCMLFGCKETINYTEFEQRTYDEYYSDLLNTTIEMDLIIEGQQASCFYTNDSNLFVFTIKYEHSSEYGYIYEKETNSLYCIENQEISIKDLSNIPSLKDFLKNLNFLFYLKFDCNNFEYITTVTICNRQCNQYRFTETIKGKDTVFFVYIDQETSFCLKAICSYNDTTNIYFQTKKFICEPSVNEYKTMLTGIEDYNCKK